jgi:hypothetical protein
MDVLTTFYPIRTLAAHLLAGGEWPFWNRSVYGGVPLLANPQWGLLYPGHWPFLLAPNARIFTAINIVHIAWLGMGIFLWLRRALRRADGRKPVAGPLLGGLLSQVGGWTWAHLAFGAYLQAAAWLPWMLLAFERSREEWAGASGRWTRRAWFWAAAGGLAGAMQWLVGAPQLALYCQAGTALYILLTGWMRDRTWCALGRALLWVVVVETTSLGLSAPQWMTTRALLRESERGNGLTQTELSMGAVTFRGLAQAWIGGTGGDLEDAEQILYPGWVALALALTAGVGTGISRIRRRKSSAETAIAREGGRGPVVVGLFALLAVSCLMAWKGLVPILFKIPLLGSFNGPRRVLFLAFFCVVCLAAVGFQILWDLCRVESSSDSPSAAPSSGYPAGCSAGVSDSPPSNRRTLFLSRILLVALALFACSTPLAFVRWNVDIKTIPETEFRNEQFAPAEVSTGETTPPDSGGVVDRAGQSDSATGGNPASASPESPDDPVRFFAFDMGIQYSYNYTRAGFGRSLMPCLPAFYGLEDIGGYDPMIPWRYALYMRRLNSVPAPTPSLHPRHFGLVRNPDSPWLKRFGSVVVRGPVDCYWPALGPKWIPPGETMRVDLVREGRSWQADPKALESVRAYLAFGRFEGRGDQGHELELRFLSGQKVVALARAVGRDIESSLENPDTDGVRLWPDVLKPTGLLPGLTLTPVHRGGIEKVQVAGEKANSNSESGENPSPLPSSSGKPLTIDAIEVHNPGGKLAVLLYSLGLPRPLPLYRPVGEPNPLGEFDTFASTWEPGFPEKIAVERTEETETPGSRRAFEEQAMLQTPTETRVELAPNGPDPQVPVQLIQGWRWMERRSNRLRVALPEGHTGGWLVLPEPFAQGWTARVDGTSVPIHPADILFRAVPVPTGAREVTMRYCPPGLTTGIFVAGLTLLLLALGGLCAGRFDGGDSDSGMNGGNRFTSLP